MELVPLPDAPIPGVLVLSGVSRGGTGGRGGNDGKDGRKIGGRGSGGESWGGLQ